MLKNWISIHIMKDFTFFKVHFISIKIGIYEIESYNNSIDNTIDMK